ncbi:MAG: hypothetical protein M3279_01260 [Actinomycetota bacterium]|nr:hypothetical protein [Actinomycetota bacterium]
MAKARTEQSGRSRNVASDRGAGRSVGAKEKVSLTLDTSLVEELRTLAAGTALSAVVNRLLSRAVEQERLAALVDELIAEAGEPPPEAYQRVLDQWEQGRR